MGAALTPTRSEFDSNQTSAQKKKAKTQTTYTYEGAYRTFTSLGRAENISNGRITVESPVLETFKTHQYKPYAT